LLGRFGPIADHLKFASQTRIGNPGRAAAVRSVVPAQRPRCGTPARRPHPRLFSIAQKARRVLGSKAVTRPRNPGNSSRCRETKCQAKP
jgi:hypothetical protein